MFICLSAHKCTNIKRATSRTYFLFELPKQINANRNRSVRIYGMRTSTIVAVLSSLAAQNDRDNRSLFDYSTIRFFFVLPIRGRFISDSHQFIIFVVSSGIIWQLYSRLSIAWLHAFIQREQQKSRDEDKNTKCVDWLKWIPLFTNKCVVHNHQFFHCYRY